LVLSQSLEFLQLETDTALNGSVSTSPFYPLHQFASAVVQIRSPQTLTIPFSGRRINHG
jgi:hypothetical protein